MGGEIERQTAPDSKPSVSSAAGGHARDLTRTGIHESGEPARVKSRGAQKPYVFRQFVRPARVKPNCFPGN